MVWPPIRFSLDTVNYELASPASPAPSRENWLGTDDQGRDVLARAIYGFRISLLFGLALTLASTAFVVLAVLLSLLIFVFEGVRDAFDPCKTGLP